MRFRFWFSVCSTVLLAGCSHIPFHSQSHSYLQESGSIPEVQSTPTAQIKLGPNFFPLPPIENMQVARQTPSLVPPGSNLERFKKQAAAPSASAASAPTPQAKALVQSQNGLTILSAKEPVAAAWKDLPKALAQTPYHILDQDESMESYYVLDTTQTKGQITQATPIYRMSLVQAAASTSIELTGRDGSPVPANISQRILSTVAQNWVL